MIESRFAAVALVVLAGCHAGIASTADPSAELRRAVAIGDAFLPTLGLPADMQLIEVRNRVVSDGQFRPRFWLLTYSSCRASAWRDDDVPACKGGETYIEVDMKTGHGRFAGAGE